MQMLQNIQLQNLRDIHIGGGDIELGGNQHISNHLNFGFGLQNLGHQGGDQSMSTDIGHSRLQALHDTHSFIVSAISSEEKASGPSCPVSARRKVFARPRVTSRSALVAR